MVYQTSYDKYAHHLASLYVEDLLRSGKIEAAFSEHAICEFTKVYLLVKEQIAKNLVELDVSKDSFEEELTILR